MKFLRFFQIAFLIMMAAGAQPAYSALWMWSHTASQNGNSDPTINYLEGQSPSSLNDSARAMMARIADYRDDVSGALVAGGTSTAYTLTTNQGLASVPTDGQLIAFTFQVTNGDSPTLTVDGGTTYPILQLNSGVAIPAGTLIAGSPYTFKFAAGTNGWLVRDFYGNALTVPLGAMIPYTGTSAPNSNFVFPVGQCLSTSTYATYWALLGTPASGSCSGGQFRIVNMSGTVPAALDTMPGGSAANRLTSSSTGCGTAMTTVGATCANGAESTTILLTNLPPITPSGSITNGSISAGVVGGVLGLVAGGSGASNGSGQTPTSLSISVSQGASSFNGATGGGSSTPAARVMPTTGVNYLLRVL